MPVTGEHRIAARHADVRNSVAHAISAAKRRSDLLILICPSPNPSPVLRHLAVVIAGGRLRFFEVLEDAFRAAENFAGASAD